MTHLCWCVCVLFLVALQLGHSLPAAYLPGAAHGMFLSYRVATPPAQPGHAPPHPLPQTLHLLVGTGQRLSMEQHAFSGQYVY